MTKLIFILFVSLFVFCNCSLKRDKIDYIVYGMYAGECTGHCSIMYKLENERLLVDTTDSFFNNNSEGVTFKEDTLSRDEFLKAQIIKRRLPAFLLQSGIGKFGCPDCRDQGGIFIEIKSGLVTKKFYLDPDLNKLPHELKDYAKLIMEVIGNRMW